MKEIWKYIHDYEGLYQVSNLGRVKSFWHGKERILKPGKNNRGYLFVFLCNGVKKNKTIHKLVAETFLGHKSNGYKTVVDHIDNNKSNNRVDNLQITTSRNNVVKEIDKTKTTSKYTGVHWDKKACKYLANIRVNGKKKYLGQFNCEYEAHLEYQKALNNLNK